MFADMIINSNFMDTIFIHAGVNNTEAPGYESTAPYLKNEYNYMLPRSTPEKEFDDLRREILRIEHKNKRMIITGGDHSIAPPVLRGIMESSSSPITLVMFDHGFDLGFGIDESPENSALLGCIDMVGIENVILLGTQDSNQATEEWLCDNNLIYFPMKKIRQLGINKILGMIVTLVPPENIIHISLDIRVFSNRIAPSVVMVETNREGMQNDEIKEVLEHLAPRIRSMDISGFNTTVGNDQDLRQTAETIRYCMVYAFGIKEKKINVMNEASRFLIFRHVDQVNQDDLGWFILRGVPIEEQNRILESIGDDSIITLEVDDHDILVTATTIEEQNRKSYFEAESILDTVLFPNEKQSMVFELVNK